MSVNFPAFNALPARSTSQAPAAAPLPKESVIHRAEEEAADAVLLAARVPFLNNLGLKLYGLMAAKPKATQKPLYNNESLTPTIERGAQPTEAGFALLKQQGTQTVINLRVESNWEQPIVKKLGMKYLYMPMPAVGAPTNAQGLAFLSAATDPANGKVFFHCQHGADRTGAMAAIYHITKEGWSVDKAIAEMPEYNFHQGFEDAKITFVRDFAKYWATLPAAKQAEVLHTGLNITG